MLTYASTLPGVTSNNFITRAYINLNSKLTFNNGSTSIGLFYLKSVLMHELGHALGLCNNENPSSIMYEKYTESTILTNMK